MISQISFTNFKSWRVFPKTHFGMITAFFGINSSGKTSIINLLLMLKQTLDSSDRSQALDLGNINSYTELGSFDEILHNHIVNDNLLVDLSFSFLETHNLEDPELRKTNLFSDNTLQLISSIQQTAKKRIFVDSFSYTFDNQKFTMKKQEADRYDYSLSSNSLNEKKTYSIKRTPGRVWPLPEPVKFHGFPDQVRSYYQNTSFLFDLQLLFEEAFSKVFYLGPLRENPKRQYSWTGSQPADMGKKGERCIEALLSSRVRDIRISPGYRRTRYTVEQYVAKWLKELGLIHSFRITEIASGSNIYQVKVKRNSNSSEVLITDVGFGVSQILPVLTLCYYVPEGSTLLLEQPEIHLHPKVQSGLADVFIDAIKVKKIQIILESHSEHLLRRLQRRIAESKLSNKDITAFFCDNNGDESSLIPLDVDMFGIIKNWPKDFFGDEMGEMAAMTSAIRKRKDEQ